MTDAPALRQAALPFVHEPTYGPAAFVPDASNAEARSWLRAPWPAGRLALWGPAGCGKTHLLHLWAGPAAGTILSGSALPAPTGLPGAGGLAVDDADRAPEQRLLHLLNAAAEDGRPVLLAARSAPARWPTSLPDLASRLRATAAAPIAPPGDAMLRTLFDRLLRDRQLAVPVELRRWLLLRLPREAAALREAAARLDEAALEAGRRVSHALATQVLAELDRAA